MVMLDLDVGDAQEPTTLEADSEVKLRIVSGKLSQNKDYLVPRFEIVDEPLAKELTHPVQLPSDEMDAKTLNRVKWNMKEFLDTFGLPTLFNPVDDLPGAEGWAILGHREDDTYGEQNTIKKFLPPK